MSSSIFTRIIEGDLPAYRVYEDADVIAFLDIMPLAFGHTLVVPKEPAVTLDQLSARSAAAVGRVLPEIARTIMAVTGCRGYNVLQNNGAIAHQAVMHVHFHVIPRYEKGSEPESAPGAGLGIVWPARTLEPDEAADLVARIDAYRLSHGGAATKDSSP